MTPSPPERPVPNGWPYAEEPTTFNRIGISLSGGGIRSATFSLGVYQRLAEAGIFQRARYVSAVSGGGYLACGLAISHARSARPTADPQPWGRGSAEESRLRQNLSYLAPGGTGRAWLLTNLLYGLLLNLTPLILGAYVAGHAEGLLLHALYPRLGTSHVDLSTMKVVGALIVAAVALAVAAVGWRRFNDGRPHDAAGSECTARRLTQLAVVLLAALVIAPLIVQVLGKPAPAADQVAWRIRRIEVGTLIVACALGLGAVALALQSRRRLTLVRALLAGVAGSSVLLVPFALATQTAATLGWDSARDAALIAFAILVVLGCGVFVHNRRYSMHLFYRERLQDAFALARTRVGAGGDFRLEPLEDRVLLSEVATANADRTRQGDPFPELIVCAAVAARGSEVPTKARAASFTFEGTDSGNERIGLQAPTREFETDDWVAAGGLTLPSMMAISGAALSPLMGRFTLPAFRLMLAMMNIRLGVWLRKPSEPDLQPPATRLGRARAHLRRGWLEPGAWYVLKEGLGLADVNGRFVYVSDGGHWENLGLTELLRRRCTYVAVIDASGSATLADIGHAMAVARAELGVEFQFDPRATAPRADGLAESPVVVGTVSYPDTRQQCRIVFARCVLWPGAPADLQMFAAEQKPFPNHPTANQFLSGEVFDAYRALGYAVGGEVAQQLSLPGADRDEPRSASTNGHVPSGTLSGGFA